MTQTRQISTQTQAFAVLAMTCLLVVGSTTQAQNATQAQYGYRGYSQQNLQQRQASAWAVTPPSVPDSSQSRPMDHSSMSPDSWSAPMTGSNVGPLPGMNEVGRPVGEMAVGLLDSNSNAFFTAPKQNNSGASPNTNQFDPGFGSNDSQPSGLSGFDSAPSIPTLGSKAPTQVNRSNQSSPFQSTKYSIGVKQDTGRYPLQRQGENQLPILNSPQGASNGIAPMPSVLENTDRYPLGSSLGAATNSEADSFDFRPAQSAVASPFASSSAVPMAPAMGSYESRSELNGTSSSVGVQQTAPRYQAYPPATSNQNFPGQQQGQQQVYPAATASGPMFGVMPNYRPDLGHRSINATTRNSGVWDNGEKFDFEDKKKEYPPLSEIMATGRYFGSASTLYLQPAFQTNTAITTLSPTFGQSFAFDFDYEAAPQFRFGFESKYGPGFEINYWQYDEASTPISFVSNGTVSGETSTWMLGPSRWSRLVAANAGDVLDASHTLDIEAINLMLFKEIKFPISRLNGSFGLQYVSIAQTLDATVTNGGSIVGQLTSNTDMRAYGPRFMFEYYRPLGHTKLELITRFGGSVMFGERDQFVQNTTSNDFSRVGADEFLTTSEFYVGGQYKKMTAENRGYFVRAGYQYQSWLGGGTAVDAHEDFGLRGFVFGVGFNR